MTMMSVAMIKSIAHVGVVYLMNESLRLRLVADKPEGPAAVWSTLQAEAKATLEQWRKKTPLGYADPDRFQAVHDEALERWADRHNIPAEMRLKAA